MKNEEGIKEFAIKLKSGRKIILDEEILFFEVMSLLDYSKQLTGNNKLDLDFKKYSKIVKDLLEDDDFVIKLVHLSRFMNRMEIIRKLKEEKISISELTDKYGNKYLRAKMSFPEYVFTGGKKKIKHKSMSVHIGKTNDFKGGTESDEVKSLAREKLMKKVINEYHIKFDKRE